MHLLDSSSSFNEGPKINSIPMSLGYIDILGAPGMQKLSKNYIPFACSAHLGCTSNRRCPPVKVEPD